MTYRYSTLFGAGPDVKSMDKFNILQRSTAHSAAGYRKFFTTKNLKERLPKLNQDIAATFDALDLSKASDSFEIFYGLIYQLTQRSLGCNDVADSPELLAKTLEMFTRLDCTSGVEVMFPSLVTPNKRQKKEAGRELFQIMHTIMEKRRQSGERGDDAMQRLMDDGDSDLEITFFIVRALFAGLLNTGVNASWIPVYLAQDTEWRDRVRTEVDAIISKYRQTADEAVTDVLARVELEDWEEGFPTIALALKESIRMNVPGSAFRKNMSGKDIQIPGTNTIIPKDAFACFLLDDRHMNPDIYVEPETWNPRRYLEGRAEDKKSPNAYLGWGTGLHPCLGTRFAKLETHMAVATFVARFDFELCDKDMGPRTSPLPVTDRDWHSAKPIFGDMYLKITKRQ
ncbi:hypothetical protein VHEMI10176 [[Torrubiella] hemipterigena]|uniref:Cytochrome P450 n=1 Tax=[Torrubiella] hemipterigena TaxID=1531966 RepID=A0A0A1TRR7_9HYPO|nr:hypothetical protein VHEMI10176 [[Torrubiella] hemipterigena]